MRIIGLFVLLLTLTVGVWSTRNSSAQAQGRSNDPNVVMLRAHVSRLACARWPMDCKRSRIAPAPADARSGRIPAMAFSRPCGPVHVR